MMKMPTMWLIWFISGCSVDVPEYPFDEQYDSFAFNSLLTRQESIQAIGLVGTECNKVAAMSLFHIPTAKHMRLEEFEQTQSQATSHVSTSVKGRRAPLFSVLDTNIDVSKSM